MDNSAIRQLLEPVVEDMGYELVTVELTGSPSGGQVLRTYIDAPGGILLEDCEQVSRQVSAILDVEDPIKGEYTLEVSSPGVDRPLVKPEHFQRFQGSHVKVVMREARLGRRRFTGLLVEAAPEFVVVEVDGEPYELDYQTMEKANLVGLD
ncbi:MAG: ribosome maturation factor RimP [Acidiferrobacteraceae bacterium]|nr:ribosome maturation factor RimP [Acidiferrobacteraceae bacterium]